MITSKRLILGMAAAVVALIPVSAQASIQDTVDGLLHQFAEIAHPDAVAPPEPAGSRNAAQIQPAQLQPSQIAFQSALPDFSMPSLPSVAIAELPTPSVETPLKRIACVEYARARSGLAVFGDAKFWWMRAKNLYARFSEPVTDAVMVFAADRKLKLGHVAVVTNIVSRREIRVDQANWQNHGEIDHSTPILDVSARNDWSQVRVWDMRSASFGSHVYAISGFIAKDLTRQAAND